MDDAKRLDAVYRAWRAERRESGKEASQEYAAGEIGFGQSAFSQYLKGRIPLNVAVAGKFAKLFGCRVEDFSPTLAVEMLKAWPFPDIDRSRFDRLSPAQQIEIQGSVRKMILDFEGQLSGEKPDAQPVHIQKRA